MKSNQLSLFPVLIAAMLSPITPALASELGNDGCYRTYKTGARLPAWSSVVCVRGTTEEGIEGSGVRVALLAPDASPASPGVEWCARTISSGRSDARHGINSLYLNFDDSSEVLSIVFNGEADIAVRESGTITLAKAQGRDTVRYYKLHEG